jgi:hypothetical protein
VALVSRWSPAEWCDAFGVATGRGQVQLELCDGERRPVPEGDAVFWLPGTGALGQLRSSRDADAHRHAQDQNHHLSVNTAEPSDRMIEETT